MNWKNRKYYCTLQCCFLLLSVQSIGQNISTDSINILFKVNRYNLEKNDVKGLDSFLFRHDPNIDSVIIIGQADSSGNRLYNYLLSEKRCKTVAGYFEKNTNIRMVPLGEDGPDAFSDKGRSATVKILYHAANQPNQQSVSNSTIIDTIVVLDLIYFKPDLPILTPESRTVLPRYIQELAKYKGSRIEIRGHVNHADSKLPENDPLFKLSIQRAKTIYDYFIGAGYSPELMKFRGMGNLQMLYPDPMSSLEEKRKNMRVEVVIFK
jgi:outer membrane protein OmpA-like peptidoglycan-associated protein